VKTYFRPAGASIESQAEPDDSMLKLLRRTGHSTRPVCAFSCR